MIELTQEEFNNLFKEYPQVRKAEHGEPLCPYCGNALSPEALNYYNGATEAGTDCCSIEINCDVCDKTIWESVRWTTIEDRDDLIETAEDALEREIN